MSSKEEQLTAKALATRERILNAALGLFSVQGYDQTTMREIAGAAGCSLGLAYRYFTRKEDLVQALYLRLGSELLEQVKAMPVGSLAERFELAMRGDLERLAPFRPALAALFGAAMNPDSGVGVFGGASAVTQALVMEAFRLVVVGADAAPPPPQDAQLATLLYALHLALIFAWLTDSTPDKQAAEEALRLTVDLLRFAGVVLLPGSEELLARLATTARMILAPEP